MFIQLNKPLLGAYMGFPGGSVIKNLPANAGDMSLFPGLGRYPGEGNSNPLQYSSWATPGTEKKSWQAMVCGDAKLDTTEHTCT